MTTHELKTWPHYYSAIMSGHKTFEARKNDRGFGVNDLLHLREWDPETGEYTGREAWRRVTFLLSKYEGLKEDYVVMGLGPA